MMGFMSILIMLISPNLNIHKVDTLFFMNIVLISFYVMIFIISLIRTMQKPVTLCLNDRGLVIDKTETCTQSIKAILISGKIIGVKPVGKKIVPLRYCFEFADEDNQVDALEAMMDWANQHHIPVRKTAFVRWI
ncbi:hypothetical protein [Paenibacillus sp. N3.4]|uniref:hypothetical protein n=1 Tax=Paenibacillus sp. N3.4 TaxID=2603222 RepID=UPI001C9C456B|nr:hypothetical protein [Paenibacillus sp. N3.4]